MIKHGTKTRHGVRYAAAVALATALAAATTAAVAAEGSTPAAAPAAAPTAAGAGVAAGTSAGGPVGAPAGSGGVAPGRRPVCALTADNIRQLRSGLPQAGDPESLRDATWLLQERLLRWNDSAEGMPEAAGPLAAASDVAAAWVQALDSHDAGKPAGTRAALTKAEAALQTLERQLLERSIPGCA